ncbi:MAG: hypothetical protein ACQETH_05045 [Candidatus Rifleibacteriota bacterium]
MKRLSIFLIATFLFFMIANGFAPEVKTFPFKITGCNLQPDFLELKVKPMEKGPTLPVNLKLKVRHNGMVKAVGFARVKMLNLPESDFNLDIQLSNSLNVTRNYNIEIVAEMANKPLIKNEFASVKVSGHSSRDFFDKKFKPVPEVAEIRGSFDEIEVRTAMGIN